MIPRRTHANGVPWLIWIEQGRWSCEGCAATGMQAPFSSVADFARWAGDMKRSHAACRPGHRAFPDIEGIGHPLNPDRAEC